MLSGSAPVKAYVFTVALFSLALPIAFALDAPSSCFLLVVIASSLYGGRKPALLATLLGALAFEFLFLPPAFHLRHTQGAYLRLGIFVTAALVALEMVEMKRVSDRARLEIGEDFRGLAETSPDCILMIDSDAITVFANPALTEMFGFGTSEIVGKPVGLLLPELVPGSSPNGEFSVCRKNGEQFYVEATCGRFGSKTTIFLRDISDRKRTLKRLEESEESLRLTLETIPGLVYTRSLDEGVEYANRRVSEYLGSAPEHAIDESWAESLHPDEREWVLRTIQQNVAKGEPYTMEYRRRRYDGVFRWFQTSVQPLKSRSGEVIRWYGLLTDIEDLRTMEESVRVTQAKLAQAAKIATASELAASIVHEISQPISAMVANGQACLRWLSANPPNLLAGRDAVEHIVRDGRDAGEVIRGLRSLFRRTPLEKAEFDLGQIVAEVATLLRSRVEKDNVSLEIDIAPDLPLIMGDKIQVQQVLMNLVANGIEAMQNVSHQSRSLAIRAHRDGAAVLTEVEDCGSGATNFDTIFEPFFTTKAKGMGMGLSICQSIVEAHAGKIWAGPGICGGAVFRFTLPHIAESRQ